MEAARLIERRRDPADRRAHRVYLQEAARPLVAKFREVASGCLTDAIVGVSQAEMDQVADVLTRIHSNLTGKSDTALSFAEPKAAKETTAKPAAKTAARAATKSPVNEGVTS
jgi:hypothetical protein